MKWTLRARLNILIVLMFLTNVLLVIQIIRNTYLMTWVKHKFGG